MRCARFVPIAAFVELVPIGLLVQVTVGELTPKMEPACGALTCFYRRESSSSPKRISPKVPKKRT